MPRAYQWRAMRLAAAPRPSTARLVKPAQSRAAPNRSPSEWPLWATQAAAPMRAKTPAAACRWLME